ncbi:MFS transporter [Demequina sp. NBRC 110055]|uniref:MFS transporter n=1 Tax=Demequina sp. NBRC 110055 TaxID=1570344 RepID=UPI000A06B74D|nr:MFS transporter [Demequina sp. NBRC 110055]
MSATLTAHRRRFVVLTALRWLPTGVVVPVLVLLLSQRGLSLATIGLLTAVHSATTFVLELPTGGLSDVVGRRPVLLLAAMMGGVSALVLALATTPALLMVGAVLMGASRALDSGPLQAWYVDGVHAVDAHADLTTGMSRAGVAESASLAVGALAAGAVVAVAPLPTSGSLVVALSVPFLIKAALTVPQVVAVAVWVRDEAQPDAISRADAPAHASARVSVGARARASARDVPATVMRGLRLARSRATIRRLLLLSGALGVALAGIELLAPAHAAALLGGESAAAGPYSVLVTAGFLGSAAGSSLAPLAATLARRDSRAAALGIAGAALALVGVAAPIAGVAAACFVAFYLMLGIAAPLTDVLLHREATSRERATVLSLQSMALQAAAVVATAALGVLTGVTSLLVGFTVIAAVLATGALTLVRWPAAKPAAASAQGTATVS